MKVTPTPPSVNGGRGSSLVSLDSYFKNIQYLFFFDSMWISRVIWPFRNLLFSRYVSDSFQKHTASTNSFYLVLFWSVCFTSVSCFSNLLELPLTVLCHVIFGLPILLLLCGFHSRILFLVLWSLLCTVWPIHFHFFTLTSFPICCWFMFHRCSLRIWTSQKIC